MSTMERPDMELLELAYPYAIDAVTELERAAIERRRERADRFTAAEFDADVAAVRETMAELSIVDSCAPPPELEARLMRALDRVLRVARDHGGRTRFGWLGPLSRLDAVAAVLLLVVLGTGLGFAGYRMIDRPALDALSTSMIDRQPDVTSRTVRVSGGGDLEIHVSQALSAASISFRSVPAPPPGSAYQVWLVPLGGTAHSVALLPTPTDGPVVTTFHAVDTLAVTVEPVTGSPQPTTSPIASLNLIT